jgi:DNA adenine methylase
MGLGRLTSGEKNGWKNDVIGRERAYAKIWWCKLPERIVAAALRLKDAQITNEPAIKLIKRFNDPSVLIYADPPYVLSTRNRRQYKYEMTDADHEELLAALQVHKGCVILSGYDNDLYRRTLKDWSRLDYRCRAQTGESRIETIWTNFPQSANLFTQETAE